MLMSIDRVLRLLAEGKSLEKIAELAGCEIANVIEVIEEAIVLLNKCEKHSTRKKFIIRKNVSENSGNAPGNDLQQGVTEESILFEGAELTTIPVDSSLTMYTDGASSGNPGPSGIGIVILDHDGRQVGKVSSYIGRRTNNFAEYSALIRALKIAIYFKTSDLKIRTDSELIVKQMSGEYRVKNDQIRKLYEEAMSLAKNIDRCKIEHVPRTQNEKADFLARKAVQ